MIVVRLTKLRPDPHATIVSAIRGAAYTEEAAEYAGVTRQNIEPWLARGQTAVERADEARGVVDAADVFWLSRG